MWCKLTTNVDLTIKNEYQIQLQFDTRLGLHFHFLYSKTELLRVAQEALFFALSIVLFNTTNCNFCINIYWRYGWRKKAYHRKTKEFLVSQPKNSFVFPYLLVILKKRESRYILFLQFLQQHCMSFSLWFWFLSQGFPCLAATLSHSSSSVFSYENCLLE